MIVEQDLSTDLPPHLGFEPFLLAWVSDLPSFALQERVLRPVCELCSPLAADLNNDRWFQSVAALGVIIKV